MSSYSSGWRIPHDHATARLSVHIGLERVFAGLALTARTDGRQRCVAVGLEHQEFNVLAGGHAADRYVDMVIEALKNEHLKPRCLRHVRFDLKLLPGRPGKVPEVKNQLEQRD